jgi:hypothetical protein
MFVLECESKILASSTARARDGETLAYLLVQSVIQKTWFKLLSPVENIIFVCHYV